MSHRAGSFQTYGVLAVLGAALWSPSASAAILEINARISAEVEEIVAGDAGAFDSAFEEFLTTSVSLPIQVVASLLPDPTDFDSNGAGALAFSDFRDPTLSPEANPEEFGLEANVFSLNPFTRFTAFADATETRRILFSAEELQSGEGDTEQEVESSAFVSGAVLIFTLDPTRDLTGLSVSFALTVNQESSGAEPLEVFAASAVVQGRAGGEIAFQASDGIEAEVGDEELLTEAIGPLADLLLQELAGLGRIHVILIPEQELTYRYTAPIGEEFDLTALISAQSQNLPAGTGAGAVFGRSFEDLAQVIAQAIGNRSDGTLTQRAINKALSDLQAQDAEPDDDPPPPAVPAGGLCGFLGMEMLIVPLSLAGLRLVGRRRKSGCLA